MGKYGRGCRGQGWTDDPRADGERGPGGEGGCGQGRQRHGWGRGWRARMEGHFQQHGLRLTVPRQIILDILEQNEEYVGADDLYLQVREQQPGIGLATVYRTLQLLSEIGVVLRIETGDGKARFKLARGDEQRRRGLLICSNCLRTIPHDSITEEQQQLLEQLEHTIAAGQGFQVRQSVLHLYGICSECAKDNDQAGTTGTT